MHTQTVFEMNQEAERLLQLALYNLSALKQMPLAVQSDRGNVTSRQRAAVHPLHFSLRGLEAQQEMLQAELRKTTQQEMVLAIVGTMKAGKSTTINAIVGKEVLPNRNRPMTALPTLIRHTPGQTEPVLHFSHAGPIETLMQALRARLQNASRDTLTLRLEIDRDMDALLARILNGTSFEKHYLGAQPIFHCLKSLNDLVRLSAVLDVPFPFRAYAAIEHIPVIEVEFTHLAGMERGLGQLTLLDTPGPNEAGQPHLQKMLQEQIARASAVLAVMDYTQLKSISDEEVRMALAAVGESVPLYALVNKFDQLDRNSDDEDQVRALVAGTLMKGAIDPAHIFPVSSMWGYLANRARQELAAHGTLPPYDEQRWVQDFAEAALGRRWRYADFTDATHLRHAADLLWEDSLFEAPIRAILHTAHAHASLYALRSACAKLIHSAQCTRDYLDFRCQGLDIANDQLVESISQMNNDIAQLKRCQADASKAIQEQVVQALGRASETIAGHEQKVLADIASYFETGKVPSLSLSSPVRRAVTWGSDFDAGSEQLILDQESDARMLLHKIRASCELILLSVQENLTRDLAAHFSDLETALGDILHAALAPLELRVTEGLRRTGFRAHITLPVFQRSQLNFNAHQLFNDVIEEESVPVASAPRNNGVRGTVARWITSKDLGWDDCTAMRSRYVINLQELKQTLSRYVSRFCAQIRQAMNAQVDISVTAGMATFFAEFQMAMAAIEANLQQSLAARQQSETARNALREKLQQCARTARDINEDARALRDDIQTLFSVEH
ncbi:clamp-binding protein CrfC [Cronobacter turicensis]|nr:clamp-binding protein CrfC [Cronobacter turicensis]